MAQLQDENDDLVTRIKAMSTQLTELAIEKEQLMDDAEKSGSVASAATAQMQEYRVALEAAEATSNDRRAALDKANEALETALEEVRDASRMESSLRERLETAEVEIDDANTECLRLEEEVKKLAEENNDLVAEKEDMEQHMGAMEDELARTKDQVRETQRTVSSQLDEIDRLQKIGSSETYRMDLERRDWEDEKQDLARQLDSLASSEQLYHKSEANLKVTRADLAVAQKESSKLREELSNLQEVLTKITERSALKESQSVERTRHLVKNHDDAVADIKLAHERELAGIKEASASSLAEEKRKREELELEREDLKARLSAAEAEVEAAKSEKLPPSGATNAIDDFTVDSRIVSRLVSTYVQVGIDKGPGAAREVLAILANMLDFDEDQRKAAGLKDGYQPGGRHRNLGRSGSFDVGAFVFGPRSETDDTVLPGDVEGKTFDELLIGFLDSNK